MTALRLAIESHISGLEQVITQYEATASKTETFLSDETIGTWLSKWLNDLQPNRSPIGAYEISLQLTDDAGIQRLNADYRHQNKPTDVLSFAALETDIPGVEQLYQTQPTDLGDIVISVETAQRQAVAQHHSLDRELAWLAAHGLLHLLGWDHPDEHSLTEMLSKQAQLLSLVGFE